MTELHAISISISQNVEATAARARHKLEQMVATQSARVDAFKQQLIRLAKATKAPTSKWSLSVRKKASKLVVSSSRAKPTRSQKLSQSE